MKRCFKCGATKPIDEFYKHPQMADGHLNKCKSCTKKDVHENYHARHEYYTIYERERTQRPERREQAHEYRRQKRQKHPEKARAYRMVQKAVSSGRLVKTPCELCGSNEHIQGHHENYSRPLDVRWLCHRCHRTVAHGEKCSDVPYNPKYA